MRTLRGDHSSNTGQAACTSSGRMAGMGARVVMRRARCRPANGCIRSWRQHVQENSCQCSWYVRRPVETSGPAVLRSPSLLVPQVMSCGTSSPSRCTCTCLATSCQVSAGTLQHFWISHVCTARQKLPCLDDIMRNVLSFCCRHGARLHADGAACGHQQQEGCAVHSAASHCTLTGQRSTVHMQCARAPAQLPNKAPSSPSPWLCQ